MKKLSLIVALSAVSIGAVGVTAEAGVSPAMGTTVLAASNAGKSVDGAAGSVAPSLAEPVHYRRHHHRRYVYIVPRYYGYRSYGRRW